MDIGFLSLALDWAHVQTHPHNEYTFGYILHANIIITYCMIYPLIQHHVHIISLSSLLNITVITIIIIRSSSSSSSSSCSSCCSNSSGSSSSSSRGGGGSISISIDYYILLFFILSHNEYGRQLY